MSTADESKQQKKDAKLAAKLLKREEATRQRDERMAASDARRAEQDRVRAEAFSNAGKLMGSEVIGTKTVKFYDNGFVTVSTFRENLPEKLIAIATNVDVQKKSGLGRALVGVATMGLNIGATSNMRGDIYVTISTDLTTHMIHETPPSEASVKRARKAEALGTACIAMGQSNSTSSAIASNTSLEPDLASQLKNIGDLHSAGILTEDEFVAAKAKLLGS